MLFRSLILLADLHNLSTDRHGSDAFKPLTYMYTHFLQIKDYTQLENFFLKMSAALLSLAYPPIPLQKKPFSPCTLTIQKRDPALHIFNVSTADKAPGIVKLCLFCNVSSSILVIVHQLKFLQAASVNARIIYPTYHQHSKTVSFNLLMLHMRRISVYKNLYTEK